MPNVNDAIIGHLQRSLQQLAGGLRPVVYRCVKHGVRA